MSEILENEAGNAKRPTFLTVLCILTFIGSGWGIISALTMKEEGLSNYASYYYWVLVVLNVLTLFGAFQMWQQKKTGLYIWTLAEIASVILTWVVVKGYLASIVAPISAADAQGSQAIADVGNAFIEGAMNTMLIIASVFPAAFILMYWLNAKHLK
jgi:hypothetical protein